MFKVMHDSMERENKPVVAEDGTVTTIYSPWPRLQAHYYLMLSHPKLSEYLNSERFYPFPGIVTALLYMRNILPGCDFHINQLVLTIYFCHHDNRFTYVYHTSATRSLFLHS